MKYCDLVMKGGITSGIVYPNAVLTLAREFRFKSVGGTSAGAIAAAVTAAAAYGDRRIANGDPAMHDAPGAGFDGLRDVAAQLTTQGFIHRLFQPAMGVRNAYRALVVCAGAAPKWKKIAAASLAVLATAPLEFLLVFGLLLALGYSLANTGGLLAMLTPSFFCGYAAATVSSVLRVARVVRGNQFGLCVGMRERGASTPALTEWLHATLQRLAGKPLDAPLTFADLCGAPRFPGEPATPDALVLRMITTSISHREPRTLPFRDVRFWFLREEFDRLFPKVVVDWMVDNGGAPEQVEGKTYYPLPADDDLPVLVATRMSLSFPLLVSAVPLHEPAKRMPAEPEAVIEPERAPATPAKSAADSVDQLAAGGARTPSSGTPSTDAPSRDAPSNIASMRTVWFSDGGIGSNFPIHLFDAALPLWPTFAINLVYAAVDDTSVSRHGAIFLPERNAQGWQRTYARLGDGNAAGDVAGFLFGIVATMQNWRDLLLARAPGQRDRIVHVALEGDEGGMNLNMPQAVLERIAAKGAAAGERFNAFSFENHYWIRWRNLASGLQRYTLQVARTHDATLRIPDYASAYALPESPDAAPPSYPYTDYFQRNESTRLLLQLVHQGEAWADMQPDLTQGAPRPLPQMTITPIY
ncbi:patatin-like phospholipase family protein [Lysobacter sp. A6]|uniref:Patatin-like phospholipase family protein n=1 Tax=Noviluteimonas lactosilytica TaxID=2888523 RepID=A0ABS8JG11_9GAMM|nr:patatin-like phospholipase family protein [Lysobacter lactosilyticus]MCC8362413.1 patatin-like phospholipase family protein [Lysobacter lactosilyticus]